MPFDPWIEFGNSSINTWSIFSTTANAPAYNARQKIFSIGWPDNQWPSRVPFKSDPHLSLKLFFSNDEFKTSSFPTIVISYKSLLESQCDRISDLLSIFQPVTEELCGWDCKAALPFVEILVFPSHQISGRLAYIQKFVYEIRRSSWFKSISPHQD